MAMASHDNWQSGKSLKQSASFMLDNDIATDVAFKFTNSNEILKAHRFVLMARSHVFFVMFNSSLDKPGEAIEHAIFKEFLKYLYSDETTLSTEKALHLTYCAEKYEVTDLKAKCTDVLRSQVDEKTIAMILDHAVLYSDDVLISTCRDIIEPMETLNCLQEHHVTKDTMELVLGFEGLVLREVDIFKFCYTWAENECKRMEVPVNTSNRRKMLGPLLKKIPFCSMTHEQFATEVSGKHLLNGQEELQIFRFICAPDKSNPPFPCKTKKKTKKPFLVVKLPNMQDWPQSHCRTNPFKLQIYCNRPYTLRGLGFTKAGDYNFKFDNCLDSVEEKFSIQENNLEGFLKTPFQYEGFSTIQSIYPVSGVRPTEHLFTHVEHVKGQACPIQLGFVMNTWNQPPFDTLLLHI